MVSPLLFLPPFGVGDSSKGESTLPARCYPFPPAQRIRGKHHTWNGTIPPNMWLHNYRAFTGNILNPWTATSYRSAPSYSYRLLESGILLKENPLCLLDVTRFLLHNGYVGNATHRMGRFHLICDFTTTELSLEISWILERLQTKSKSTDETAIALSWNLLKAPIRTRKRLAHRREVPSRTPSIRSGAVSTTPCGSMNRILSPATGWHRNSYFLF